MHNWPLLILVVVLPLAMWGDWWRQREMQRARHKRLRAAITEIVAGDASEYAAVESLKLFRDMSSDYATKKLPWDQKEYNRLRSELWAKLITDKILNLL